MSFQLRNLIRKIVPKKWHIAQQLERKVLQQSQGRVLAGPFRGMRLTQGDRGGVYLPKILGSYEKELHGVLNSLLKSRFDRIIVVGAGDGFYPVGFSLNTSGAEIVSFEAIASAAKSLDELAILNNIPKKIQSRGLCDMGNLRDCLSNALLPFIFMDIEGGEAILLDPDFLPELRRACIVVELHEGSVPGTKVVLNRRFSDTHQLVELITQPRTIEDFPFPISEFYEGAALQMMSEHRGGNQSWLFIKPNSLCGGRDRADLS